MEFASGAGRFADLVDVDVACFVLVSADGSEVEDFAEDTISGLEFPDAEMERAEAADLVFGRDGAVDPRDRFSRGFIDDEAEALSFGIFEIKNGSVVAFGDVVREAEVLAPPGEGGGFVDPQAGAGDAAGAALFGRGGPVEEGEIGPGRAGAVGIEKVVGGDVVLVDRLFDEAQAEGMRVEAVVVAGAGGDGGDVVEAVEVHATFSRPRMRTSRPSAWQKC